MIDEGAARALAQGKSLLPAGVIKVEGQFMRGDAVIIKSLAGQEIGRGLIAHDAQAAQTFAGKKSPEIATILGFKGRSTLIHRDDMALAGGAEQ